MLCMRTFLTMSCSMQEVMTYSCRTALGFDCQTATARRTQIGRFNVEDRAVSNVILPRALCASANSPERSGCFLAMSSTPLSSISMVAYGAVDFIPHFGELPFRDAALVVDEVVIELDAEPRPVEIALQDDVALRHHKRLLDVALPHWAALHIGWPSLNGLTRRHLMRSQVRDRR